MGTWAEVGAKGTLLTCFNQGTVREKQHGSMESPSCHFKNHAISHLEEALERPTPSTFSFYIGGCRGALGRGKCGTRILKVQS